MSPSGSRWLWWRQTRRCRASVIVTSPRTPPHDSDAPAAVLRAHRGGCPVAWSRESDHHASVRGSQPRDEGAGACQAAGPQHACRALPGLELAAGVPEDAVIMKRGNGDERVGEPKYQVIRALATPELLITVNFS